MRPQTEGARKPLELGTSTLWGTIAMIGSIGGERYYWMIDRFQCVAMMPADVVETRHVK